MIRSQAPSLEFEVDFQAGNVVVQGTDADLAFGLPQVCALVANLKQELRKKLAHIRGRMAAEARAEEMMQQCALEAQRSPKEAHSTPALGERLTPAESFLQAKKQEE